MRVLVFGGTGEARELADQLAAEGVAVTTSLAGRTLDPLLPRGSVRIGGFGDYPRLRAFLADEAFDAIVDATHPFADKISTKVAMACQELGLRLIRLQRPPWEKPDGATWIDVESVEEAGNHLPDDAVVLDTTGQKTQARLNWRRPIRRIIRLIEPAAHVANGRDTIIVDRPPHTLEGELVLMREYGVTHLLTKNSGGQQTRPKIDAAMELGVAMIVISRPALPPATVEVATIADALRALHEVSA